MSKETGKVTELGLGSKLLLGRSSGSHNLLRTGGKKYLPALLVTH